MKQSNNPVLDNTICGIENIISQKIKSREVRISINAMAFAPETKVEMADSSLLTESEVSNKKLSEAIDECQTSIEKLLLIGDNLSEKNVNVIKSLLNNNAFDIRSFDEICLILNRKKGIFRVSKSKSAAFKA